MLSAWCQYLSIELSLCFSALQPCSTWIVFICGSWPVLQPCNDSSRLHLMFNVAGQTVEALGIKDGSTLLNSVVYSLTTRLPWHASRFGVLCAHGQCTTRHTSRCSSTFKTVNNEEKLFWPWRSVAVYFPTWTLQTRDSLRKSTATLVQRAQRASVWF